MPVAEHGTIILYSQPLNSEAIRNQNQNIGSSRSYIGKRAAKYKHFFNRSLATLVRDAENAPVEVKQRGVCLLFYSQISASIYAICLMPPLVHILLCSLQHTQYVVPPLKETVAMLPLFSPHTL